MRRSVKRRRPAMSVCLSQEAIDYIEDFKDENYNLSFSRALDRIILEHKGFPKRLESHQKEYERLKTKIEELQNDKTSLDPSKETVQEESSS